MSDRPELRIVSNGHGEDVIGARLAHELRRLRPGLRIRALPLVGVGRHYRAAGVPVEGPVRALPSAGLTMVSARDFARDWRAGLPGLLGRQLSHLLRDRSDVLLVVGDVYAQALAALARARARYVFQPLVSAWAWPEAGGPPQRYFMERIAYPERALMRHLARRVYARDAATAARLRDSGVPRATFLGNPVVDEAQGRPLAGLAPGRARVAVLPGTRAWAERSLDAWVRVLGRLPEVDALVAWAGSSPPAGWEDAEPCGEGRWRRSLGPNQVELVEGRFGDVLASADAAAGHTGTAHEQAVAMGLPVVTGPLLPDFGEAFVRNQARLLGPAAHVAWGGGEEALAGAVRDALRPESRDAARRVAHERLGPAGGAGRIAADVAEDAVRAGAWPLAANP